LPRAILKIRTAIKTTNVHVVGVFSHLANSEERSSIRTRKQIDSFTTLQKSLDISTRVVRHIACTAAVIRYPEAHFGLIRPGIGLYGLWPSAELRVWSRAHQPKLELKPVLAWYSRLSQIKNIPAGTSIGYGSTITVKRPTKLGVVPVGYADGYDRRLSNRGWVVVNGQRAPVVGRISMNLLMVDLSKTQRARVGHMVTLIGPGVSVTELERCGIFGYEFLARLSSAIPRRVI
jgi:alanine racemase